jgi:hypothetical protein
METCDLQAPAQSKHLNRSRRKFARLTVLAKLRDVPKISGIGMLEAATQTDEI